MNFNRIYSGKRVLVTGDTGFKGSWLSLWLHHLGAEVFGIALPPEQPTGPYCSAELSDVLMHRDLDITKFDELSRAILDVEPDVVFHLAAQAIVRTSYEEPLRTLQSNIMGTAHVLESLRRLEKPCAMVCVTSDKCYENREWPYSYRESDAMGGHDPYSMSKGAAELVVSAYRRSFFQSGTARAAMIATARAGNVIGPGDFAKDRIIPDAIRAFTTGTPVEVRNPGAVRPWQHVLEPISGYLALGQKLLEQPGDRLWQDAWNFGPYPDGACDVGTLIELACSAWGSGASWIGQKRASDPHEANFLRLSVDKAVAQLGWRPVWSVEEAVRRTVTGYQAMTERSQDAKAVREWMAQEIDRYAQDAAAKGCAWAEPS